MNKINDFVIETRNLSKSFGAVQALKDVSLCVPKHSIFGFLGPNGAGKTTLMKILLGLSKPTSGSGSIFGHDILQKSVSIRERIGYLSQQPNFIKEMTARENLLFTARFFFNGPQAKIQERCDEMLGLVELADKADRPVKSFSGGEKQRLGIALAQVNQPDLLILDEPASALDPLGRAAVLEIMQRLRAETTIFYSTHILDDVQRVSDCVAILNRGELLASAPIEEILNGQGQIAYLLKVKGDTEAMQKRLRLLPWVTRTSLTRQNGTALWQVDVSDEQAAELDLLSHIQADGGLRVLEFSRRRLELEDVFMEMVNGGSHVSEN